MHPKIREILEKCNLAYSKGEFYTLDIEDTVILEQILNIIAPPDEVTDQIYDAIYYEAKDMWPDDLFFNKLTSENTGYGQDIVHEIPMGSMDELKEGDFEKWSKGHTKFMVSDKLDGCSIILTYVDGRLKIAATRGHGTKGKDIMRHIKYVSNIPEKINALGKFIVRGELLFKKDKINDVLTELEKTTGKKQKNGRNSISGALNAKETNEYIFKNTHFVAYWSSDLEGLAFEQLKSLDFEVPFHHEIYNNPVLKDKDLINMVETRHKNSEYELDGIILTQMDNIEKGFVGGSINPKCSRKFKIGIYNNEAESTVTNINWQISRWGVFTPVLEIEPVEVAGALISNITAHNYANVLATKCGIGAKIKFKRSGLVIPKLEEVITPSQNYNLPACNCITDGVDLIFAEENPHENEELSQIAREQEIRALEYFGQKLEIEQLGYGNCAKLWDFYFFGDDICLTPVDFFNIPDEVFLETIGKNGEKIISSLAVKKSALTEVLLATATGAFGPDMGERVLQSVWDKYGRLENMTQEELLEIPGFAAARIKQYLNMQENWSNIKNFAVDLVNFTDSTKQTMSDKFAGMVVCFSGVRDKELMKKINENGGIATDNWSKTVNCLVLKDKNSTSSKALKARAMGIKILDLEEAYAAFNI